MWRIWPGGPAKVAEACYSFKSSMSFDATIPMAIPMSLCHQRFGNGAEKYLTVA